MSTGSMNKGKKKIVKIIQKKKTAWKDKKKKNTKKKIKTKKNSKKTFAFVANNIIFARKYVPPTVTPESIEGWPACPGSGKAGMGIC